MRKFILTFITALLPFAVFAADAPLTIAVPPTYVDGTALPASAITGYEIQYGLCSADKKSITGTPTLVGTTAPTKTITGLGSGTWCFQARVKTADSQSAWTVDSTTGLLAYKQIILAPSPPPSVTVGGGVGTAYMIVRQNDRFVALPVGTVPANTQCDSSNGAIVAGTAYYAVPTAVVSWFGPTRPTVVVSPCA